MRADENRSRIIPAGETFEVSVHVGNGKVRIFWSGGREGLGGLSVKDIDLGVLRAARLNGPRF